MLAACVSVDKKIEWGGSGDVVFDSKTRVSGSYQFPAKLSGKIVDATRATGTGRAYVKVTDAATGNVDFEETWEVTPDNPIEIGIDTSKKPRKVPYADALAEFDR